MKKFLTILLVVAMIFSVVACSNDNNAGNNENNSNAGNTPVVNNNNTNENTNTNTNDDNDDAGEESPVAKEPSGQIILGSTTELTGDWITYFQNNAADYDILNFIVGYDTVDMSFGGEYLVNKTVVENLETTENADGSKTYTWTIKPGLMYSNGEEITAYDYVASLLLWNSKLVGDLGGKNQNNYRLVGHEAYATGEAKEFAGVRLLGDYEFSMTIDPENLPYFYELTIASVTPEYIPFWLGKKYEIADDGNGAYFTEELTKDALEDTFNAGRNNPLYVSSGAYVVKSYDEETKTAVLEVNPNFVGDYTGQTPSIQTIIYKKVVQDTQLDELATGSVDLLIKLTDGQEVNTGFDLVDQGGFNFTDYSRAGYGHLAFVCDFGPTQFPAVRQALAHLLDRNDFARTFTEGYGSVVNGPYGEGQWFYQETKQVLNQELNPYPYSLEDAISLLEEDGWVLDENGNDYVEGIRYKMVDGELMPLILKWASSEQNPVSDLLVIKLQENPDSAAAGIKIDQDVMTFGELGNWYNRDGSQDAKYGVPTYHMFNLATNFNPVYDQSKYFSQDPADVEVGWNSNYIFDDQLEAAAKKMVLNEPEDRDQFKEDFVNFVVRWNELMPALPLYSNLYHDFYYDKLQNFNNNSLVRTSKALLYATIAE